MAARFRDAGCFFDDCDVVTGFGKKMRRRYPDDAGPQNGNVHETPCVVILHRILLARLRSLPSPIYAVAITRDYGSCAAR